MSRWNRNWPERAHVLSSFPGHIKPTGPAGFQPTSRLPANKQSYLATASVYVIPVESYMRRNGMSIMHVFCKKLASTIGRTGNFRMYSRQQGYRYTLQISRGPKGFRPILWASWSPTPCGALQQIQRKSCHLLETHEHHRLRTMFRKEELSIDRHTAVSIVHQIYGVFRDGQPMCDTFAKSTMGWSA